MKDKTDNNDLSVLASTREVPSASSRGNASLKYASIETAIGEVFTAATAKGVRGIGLNCTEVEFLEQHAGAERDRAALVGTLEIIRRYLAGEADELDSIAVDIPAGTPLQKAVWNELRKIPRGETVSYAQLAARVGRPKSARPVGNAIGQNPVPLVLPCHRVIRADGSLGGFGSGLHIKRYLLEIEGVKKDEPRMDAN